jgi:hypothetical protein
MKTSAIIVLCALTLLQAPLARAAKPESAAKPASFAPHAHSKHVYGAPMQPAVRRSKTSHHAHRPTS